jgi:pantoate--beta-alanine ligase
MVPTVRTAAELRARVAAWKAEGARIGVVPTMGALHEGHLSLVRAARAECDRVIVTLFVNPRQFEDAADLAAYPRTEAEDAAKLAPLGIDLLYAPQVEEIYPPGFGTKVSVPGLSRGLCGDHRPGHFDGVATVVTKLLRQTGADRAYFGEKDYQQLLIVRRLARDLDLDVEIIGCPTVRAPDGLALSSRNGRLDPGARAAAAALPAALMAAARRIAAGEDARTVSAETRRALEEAGFERVEYLELRRADDLAPVSGVAEAPARLLAAAWIGGVRLIDNVPVAARMPGHGPGGDPHQAPRAAEIGSSPA